MDLCMTKMDQLIQYSTVSKDIHIMSVSRWGVGLCPDWTMLLSWKERCRVRIFFDCREFQFAISISICISMCFFKDASWFPSSNVVCSYSCNSWNVKWILFLHNQISLLDVVLESIQMALCLLNLIILGILIHVWCGGGAFSSQFCMGIKLICVALIAPLPCKSRHYRLCHHLVYTTVFGSESTLSL